MPGDDIIGFVTRGFGVSIHQRDCENVNIGLASEDSPRWVRAYWAESVKESFKSTLEISAFDRDGLFAEVSSLINEMRLPCYAISARQVSDGRAVMNLTIGIANKDHLTTVMSRLKKIKNIISITRMQGEKYAGNTH